MPEVTGLLGSVRRLLATLIGMAATRLELLSNEWQEERLRLLQVLLFALFAVFSFCLGILLLVLFLVVLFWDEHRLVVLASLSMGFLVCGGVLIVMLQSKLRNGSKLFSASLAELQKDRESLGERHE
ncbi:MAG: phage holin family protein [Gammaproteobacteria bacterium]|nr:phage holin family protein [Gammaproteobacteria bacterium]MBU1480241.1 phage holin family protein [Gammaproteobacteria bacterium]